MLAFFITPIVAVTLFAIYSRAFPNWAAPSVIPALIGSTAILIRSGRRIWLLGSVILGVLVQSALLITDTVASRLPAQIVGFNNPYERILVWRPYAENAGRLAESIGARAIATDDRRTFDTLRYYWRNQPQAIVAWNVADELPFDLRHLLTSSTPEPILFVTGCSDLERLKAHFSAVEPLGIHPDLQDPRSLHFLAFKLGQFRDQGGRLRPC